ncbi:MAG: CPBP family glutamic-type intramembrane protease, partial [Planctomycetota bacterium]
MDAGIADHVFVVVFGLAAPLHTLLVWWPRLKTAERAGGTIFRIRAYDREMISQWSKAAVAMVVWAAAERPLGLLGLGWPAGWGFAVGVAITAVCIVSLHVQRIRVLRHPPTREHLRQHVAPLSPFLPHTREELARFEALSATVGICEELLYRGFLVWYVAGFLPDAWWGVAVAVVVAATVFAVGHLYQGPSGAARAFTVGLVLGGLYVLS